MIPGALIVLAMTLGYTSMDRIVSRKERVATTRHLCGGPTGVYPSRRRNPHQRLEKAHERKTLGIHHVKAIADNPRRSIDFYTGVLGLRLVKITVNFRRSGRLSLLLVYRFSKT